MHELLQPGPASIFEINAANDMKPTASEARAIAEKSLPKFYKNSLAFEPLMLKSALFRSTIGARAVYATFTEIPAHVGNRVFFKGEELRQDDQRVLLMLLKLKSGQVIDNVLEITPRSFVRDALRWADSGDSVAKLRACILRLEEAAVTVNYYNGDEGHYSFISDVFFEGGNGRWSVWLSPRLLGVFARTTTYLAMTERLALGDNFGSWLYSFIKADKCLAPFKTNDIRLLSGHDSYEQKNFNRKIKAELEKLVAAGVVSSYCIKGANLTIRKGS